MSDAARSLDVPKEDCPAICLRLPPHLTLDENERSSGPIGTESVRSSVGRISLEKTIGIQCIARRLKDIPDGECQFAQEIQIFFSIYVDHIDMAGRRKKLRT